MDPKEVYAEGAKKVGALKKSPNVPEGTILLVLRGPHPKCTGAGMKRPPPVGAVVAIPEGGMYHVGASACSDLDMPHKGKAMSIAVGRATVQQEQQRTGLLRESVKVRGNPPEIREDLWRERLPKAPDHEIERLAKPQHLMRRTMSAETFEEFVGEIKRSPDPRRVVAKYMAI